jgi:hypothetical protein
VKKIDRAEAIQIAMNIRNQVDALIDVLMPEDLEDGCPHPAESIEDLSTMDDGGERYRCTKCGAESATPFPSLSHED